MKSEILQSVCTLEHKSKNKRPFPRAAVHLCWLELGANYVKVVG